MIDPAIIDECLAHLATNVRNDTVEIAAKVAKLYGASDEVVEHILLLKQEKETA